MSKDVVNAHEVTAISLVLEVSRRLPPMKLLYQQIEETGEQLAVYLARKFPFQFLAAANELEYTANMALGKQRDDNGVDVYTIAREGSYKEMAKSYGFNISLTQRLSQYHRDWVLDDIHTVHPNLTDKPLVLDGTTNRNENVLLSMVVMAISTGGVIKPGISSITYGCYRFELFVKERDGYYILRLHSDNKSRK